MRDAERDVRLLIETKHPTRYGGLVEKTLVDLLDRFGWAGPPGPPDSLREPADLNNRVVVMSFAPDRDAPGPAARAARSRPCCCWSGCYRCAARRCCPPA